MTPEQIVQSTPLACGSCTNGADPAKDLLAKLQTLRGYTIPNRWIDDTILNPDVFRAIGYWVTRSSRHEDGSYLLYVDGEGDFVLDRTTAVEAFHYGVLRHGVQQTVHADANELDCMIHLALFGKLVFG